MGSKKSETTQKSEPPAWSKPLFTQAAGDALNLYNSKTGYNTYTGPTQADLSAPTLAGMNGALAATGYTGAPISNESINANIPDVFSIMQQAMASKQSSAPAATASRMSDSVKVADAGPGRKALYIQRPINSATGEYLTDDQAIAQYRDQQARQAELNRGR